MMGPLVSLYGLTGEQQPRLGAGLPYTVPRGTYRCSDGRWIAVSTSSDSVAARVMTVLGVGDDTRFDTFEGRTRASPRTRGDHDVVVFAAHADRGPRRVHRRRGRHRPGPRHGRHRRRSALRRTGVDRCWSTAPPCRASSRDCRRRRANCDGQAAPSTPTATRSAAPAGPDPHRHTTPPRPTRNFAESGRSATDSAGFFGGWWAGQVGRPMGQVTPVPPTPQ